MTTLASADTPSTAVSGLVLAGGQGRRVGGRDKGLLEVDGVPMAAVVADRLRRHCSTILISANRHLDDYARIADRVVVDRRPGFLGPLAGVEAALAVVQSPWLLLTPCDMPEVPDACYRDLLAAAAGADGFSLIVVDDGSRVQPLLALIHRRLQADLTRYLDSGGRSAYGWLDVTPHQAVRHPVADGLRNRNEA